MKSFFEWMREIEIHRPDITSDWSGTSKNNVDSALDTFPAKENSIQFELNMCMMKIVEMSKEMNVINQNKRELFKKQEYYLYKIESLKSKYNLDEAKRLGFTSATIKNDDNTLLEKYSKEYEKYSKEYREVLGQYLYLVERIRLIVRMKEYWGENSVLVPFDDFVKICDKYGLTCGCFDEYTGYVPEDRLKSIANIQYKLSEIDAYWITKIRKFHRITNATPSHLKEHKKRNEAYKRFCSIFPFCEYDEFIPGVELRKEGTSLFICAPKKYMKNVEVPIIDYTDPFICAYTDYGVMILERWDLEAQDEVIQSHDETQSEILRICKRLLNQLKE